MDDPSGWKVAIQIFLAGDLLITYTPIRKKMRKRFVFSSFLSCFHSITEWFGLEGTFKSSSSISTAIGRDTSHWLVPICRAPLFSQHSRVTGCTFMMEGFICNSSMQNFAPVSIKYLKKNTSMSPPLLLSSLPSSQRSDYCLSINQCLLKCFEDEKHHISAEHSEHHHLPPSLIEAVLLFKQAVI